jgi:DHA1 family bicyclomycin/chloramphenicol resistance-like MFS transporter
VSTGETSLNNHTRTHWGLAALLAALTMVSPFSLDTFFPSFPAIAAEFSLADWQLQQTITAYMVPFALMVLVHGPLSDALGRRPVVLVGLTVYGLASIACVFAPTFGSLLVFRALQGMSAGVGVAVGRAIVRDLHEGPQAQRMLASVSMIFGVAPAVAPIIGGWIHVAWGWRSVFGFMVVLALALLLISYLRLPETHPRQRRTRLDASGLARTLWGMASHREFMLLALAAGVEFSSVVSYIGAAPAIVLQHWHLSETEFHWLFVPLILGMIAGSFLSGRLAGRVAPQSQIAAGFSVTALGSGLLFVLHSLDPQMPVALQIPLLTISALGMNLVMPVVMLRMLDLFPDARGSAASVQTCVMLLIGAFSIAVLVPLAHGSMPTLALNATCASLIGFLLWRTARRAARLRGA